jgi:Delta7-sterol 5-desaturase
MFGVILYFVFASLSFYFIFDRTYLNHPKFLANQIRKEITLTMYSLPQMAIFTAPWFLAEVRGYSKLYLDPEKYGWWYIVFQFPLFLVFTDCLIYWIHRGLHHPLVYKTLHKPHHRWIVPTPYASHAFHPLDGYSQVHSPLKHLTYSSPFHIIYSPLFSLFKNSRISFFLYSFNSGQS